MKEMTTLFADAFLTSYLDQCISKFISWIPAKIEKGDTLESVLENFTNDLEKFKLTLSFDMKHIPQVKIIKKERFGGRYINYDKQELRFNYTGNRNLFFLTPLPYTQHYPLGYVDKHNVYIFIECESSLNSKEKSNIILNEKDKIYIHFNEYINRQNHNIDEFISNNKNKIETTYNNLIEKNQQNNELQSLLSEKFTDQKNKE